MQIVQVGQNEFIKRGGRTFLTSSRKIPMNNTKKFGTNAQTVTQKITDFPAGTSSSMQEGMAEHIKRFGTTAEGKTETYDKLAKGLADRKSGLGWKEAWSLRLKTLGHKNRLPRGFN